MFAADVDSRGIGPAAAPLNASRDRVFLFFRLRPPSSGWSTIVRQVALTSTASIVVALAAWQVHRPDLIRSPKRVLAHLWEDSQLYNALGYLTCLVGPSTIHVYLPEQPIDLQF